MIGLVVLWSTPGQRLIVRNTGHHLTRLEVMPVQHDRSDVMVNALARNLVIGTSIVSIGFGVWHFFVPKLWNWYSYIDSNDTELVVAVRAINVFFSLALVLFGLVNILLIYANYSNRYSIAVVLTATTILWLTRVVFQIVYPQGSMNPTLQYAMLLTFVLLTLCYATSLYLITWH